MKTVPLQAKRETNTKPTQFRMGDESRARLDALVAHRSHTEYGHTSSPSGVLREPTWSRIIQDLIEAEYNRIKGN